MDHRKRRFENITRVGGGGILGSIAVVVNQQLSSILADPDGRAWAFVVTAVLFVSALFVLQILIDKAVDIAWVRKYLIYRGDWVEGVWIDFVLDRNAAQVLGCGIIHIGFHNGDLHIEGFPTDVEGVSDVKFESYAVRCDDQRRIQFMYHKGGSAHGYAEYNFVTLARSIATEYSGWFVDTESKGALHTHALKVVDKSLVVSLRDPLQRPTAIKKLLDDYLCATGFSCASIQGALRGKLGCQGNPAERTEPLPHGRQPGGGDPLPGGGGAEGCGHS